MDVIDKITLHYRENFDALAKKAGRILKDHALGEDCVQETVEACIKYQHTFSPDKGDFDRWFNKIYWRTVNKYKSFSRGLSLADDLEALELDPAISEVYIDESELSDNYKTILNYIYVRGYTPKELEKLLGSNSVAVIYKAVHLFKKEVKRKYDIRGRL